MDNFLENVFERFRLGHIGNFGQFSKRALAKMSHQPRPKEWFSLLMIDQDPEKEKKNYWEQFGICLLNSTANPTQFHPIPPNPHDLFSWIKIIH